MHIIAIISCIGTLAGCWIAYLAYRQARAANTKLDNSKNFSLTGKNNIAQSHEGSGDNVGRDKNG